MMEDIGETDPEQMLLNGVYPASAMVSMIEDMRFWGFAEPKKGIIHLWVGKGVKRVQLMAFVAHELEHLVYGHQSSWKVTGLDREERRCDLTGAIAARTSEIVDGLLRRLTTK